MGLHPLALRQPFYLSLTRIAHNRGMTRTIALAAAQIDQAEWARSGFVWACALALIFAGRALPL